MAKWLIALLMLALLGCSMAAAEESYYLELPTKGLEATKKITVDVPGENPYVEGINPITGESWYGSYYPILVQIDTHPKALPHWGISSADIIYEMPLQKDGSTRSVALFMGTIPSYAGPVRSGRVPMASIREMWDGPWAFYGWQNADDKDAKGIVVDVDDWANKLHKNANSGSRWNYPYIEGIGSFRTLFHRENDGHHKAPYNVQVDMNEVLNLFTKESTMHPYIFTDTGLERGSDVNLIKIDYKTTKDHYMVEYTYNKDTGLYERYRYVYNEDLKELERVPYYDALNGISPLYSNVIVIRTNVTWHNNNAARPVIQLVGQGTAEIFQNGKYIRGTWVRTHDDKTADDYDSLSSRMVFLDENGEELEMKVGKTFIQIVNNDQPVVVTSSENIEGAKAQATPEPTPTPKPTREPKPTRTPKASANTPEPMMEFDDEGDEDFSFGG